jgi:threonine dehydratase
MTSLFIGLALFASDLRSRNTSINVGFIQDPVLSAIFEFLILNKRENFRRAFRGFKFVGSTVVYSHMQATGMVNDHLVTCSRYRERGRKSSAA